MTRTKIAIAGALALAILPNCAIAQTAPGWTYQYVPTTAQWNAEFASKQDYLGAAPLLITGGSMTGPLLIAAPSAATTGLNLQCGTAPSSPNNGDLWCAAGLVYAQINGSTVQLGASSGSVTSVALALPSSILTVSGSPVSLTGTLTGTLATQTANRVWAGPTSGGAAAPTFRALVNADFPSGFINAGTALTGGALAGGGTIALDKATAGQVSAGTSNKGLTADIVYTPEITVAFSTTPTFDFSTFVNAVMTLTNNITSVTASNMKAGQAGSLTFIQDGTGSRTLPATFNSNFKFPGGTQPVLSTAAGAVDVIFFSCRTTSYCLASLNKAFS